MPTTNSRKTSPTKNRTTIVKQGNRTMLVITHVHKFDEERLIEAHLFVLRLGRERKARAEEEARVADERAARSNEVL